MSFWVWQSIYVLARIIQQDRVMELNLVQSRSLKRCSGKQSVNAYMVDDRSGVMRA